MQNKAKEFDYERLISDVKAILAIEKIWGDKALNHIKIQINWKVGERISQEFNSKNEEKKYGQHLYKQISKHLGITKTKLFDVVRFFTCYPKPQYISPEITWNHYRLIIPIEDERIRRFYESQSIANKWSVRQLQEKIKTKEHEKIIKSNISLPQTPVEIPSASDIVKSIYNFNFIQLPENYSEKEFEKSLINQIGQFILELGNGFFFGGNQFKIIISGNANYIDLVFFNVHLACYVLIDLKIEKFNDSFVGQMNKYLRYFRENVNLPYMRPPIGIIICKSVDAEEVYYALEGLEKKIFISEYSLYLPTKKQIENIFKTEKSIDTVASRQTVALETLRNESFFTVKDYQQITKVSLATAQRDLQKLVANKSIKKEGKGKNTCYFIKNQ